MISCDMKRLMTFLISFLCSGVFAQGLDSLAIGNLTDAVLELQNSEMLRNGSLSVSLKNVKDGRLVFGVNQQLSLPSASTLKLVTTGTMLTIFGGDYRFKTYLEHDGVVRNDTLFGNIYVRGSGDPSLGSDRFKGYPSSSGLLNKWVQVIADAGIRYVKGEIVGDASFFDKQSVADSWIYGDLGNYYGAGVQGLNFNENAYKVQFKPGVETGDPATMIGTEPLMSYLKFQNQVLTGEKGTGDQTMLYSNPISTTVLMTGTVPQGFNSYSVKGAIPDPSFFVGNALREALQAANVRVVPMDSVRQNVGLSLLPRKLLDEYSSPALRDLCQQTNVWSINLYADSFLKHIGKRLVGDSKYGSSAKSMTDFWVARLADMRGFYIKDGSGLSPSGSVTVQNLTEVLRLMKREAAFDDFYKSIAVLGENGTVRNIGKSTKGKVRAKSGSIEGTRAFSGYVTTKSGELLCFAIIAHKYEPGIQRMVSEELVKLMVLMSEL